MRSGRATRTRAKSWTRRARRSARRRTHRSRRSRTSARAKLGPLRARPGGPAENQTADGHPEPGRQAQSQLLGQTSGPKRSSDAQAQEAAGRQQSFAPIAQNIQTTSPFAADSSQDSTKRAFASRLAEAADAVRDYGKKVAQVASYTAPLNTVQQAGIAENTGLMPTAAANQLLQSGQNIRLLPSQQAYQIAGSEGELARSAIGSTLQNEMNVLKNRYSGQESVIDLGLNNATAVNNNRATAAASDAAAGQSVGQLISTVGNLAAYGSQRFGGGNTGQPSADALLGAFGTGSVVGKGSSVPFANLPGAAGTFSLSR
jgi:hypothetical protein